MEIPSDVSVGSLLHSGFATAADRDGSIHCAPTPIVYRNTPAPYQLGDNLAKRESAPAGLRTQVCPPHTALSGLLLTATKVREAKATLRSIGAINSYRNAVLN
jgi:hypothetical protein